MLSTQLDSASSIRSFTNDLALFSTTVAGADPDLRKVIDNGSVAVNELRTFIEENKVDLVLADQQPGHHRRGRGQAPRRHRAAPGALPVRRGGRLHGRLQGARPNGRYDAHFGMVTTDHALCHRGYEGTDRRPPNNGGNRKMKENTRCLESPSQSNARGAQNAPRAGANYRAPVAGVYDPATKKFRLDHRRLAVERWGSVTDRNQAGAEQKEAWQWLLLQPFTTTE